MAKTRIPTQKRSIEKKNRIIEKGFEIICEKGYYNISTPDIAKAADVSTGIIYQYFTDKKEIFVEGMKNYSYNIMFPVLKILEKSNLSQDNMKNILNEIIDVYIKHHMTAKKAHKELVAMSNLDDEILQIIKDNELLLTKKLVEALERNNISIKNPTEKMHILIGIIENLCHEIVYHKHADLDNNIMKEEVLNLLTYLLK